MLFCQFVKYLSLFKNKVIEKMSLWIMIQVSNFENFYPNIIRLHQNILGKFVCLCFGLFLFSSFYINLLKFKTNSLISTIHNMK